MTKEVDQEKLRTVFQELQCPGVVALIEYLGTPDARGLHSIGSSTIGLAEIMKEISFDEEAQIVSAHLRTRSLHIGSADGSVTPLQWLEDLSREFGRLPEPLRRSFNGFCAELAAMSQSKSVGDIEVFKGQGVFRVPPSAYYPDMTDADLEPYRVERSEIFSGDDPVDGS